MLWQFAAMPRAITSSHNHSMNVSAFLLFFAIANVVALIPNDMRCKIPLLLTLAHMTIMWTSLGLTSLLLESTYRRWMSLLMSSPSISLGFDWFCTTPCVQHQHDWEPFRTSVLFHLLLHASPLLWCFIPCIVQVQISCIHTLLLCTYCSIALAVDSVRYSEEMFHTLSTSITNTEFVLIHRLTSGPQ